jgi:hypothetical protein
MITKEILPDHGVTLGKGCSLDIPLKNSGIRKPEVRSRKQKFIGCDVHGQIAGFRFHACIRKPPSAILAPGFLLLVRAKFS